MKTKNFFSVIFLVLGSLVLNLANVSAQTPIRPIDPSYQDGVEKYVGIAVPGGRIPTQLVNVGFTVAKPLDFSNVTYTLAIDTAFSVQREYPYGQTNDSLFLTISFQVRQHTPYGQDLLDTLTISLPGEAPFVLPLRGSVEVIGGNRHSILFAEQVFPGDTSNLPEPVTITTLDISAAGVNYKFNTNAFYADEVGRSPGIPTSNVFLNVWFTPPSDDDRNTPFTDTLSVTDLNDNTGYVLKIPVSAYSKHISVNPNPLDFGQLIGGNSDTLDLEVKVRGANATGITLSDENDFSFTRDANWDPRLGGTLHVSFTPKAAQSYTADLVFSGTNLEPYAVLLKGEALLRSVITADSTAVHFGTASVGKTVESGLIQVSLSDPVRPLNRTNFFTSTSRFSVVSVDTVASPGDESVVNVTLSFTPNDNGEFEDTLRISADFANDLRIPLFGTGENKPVLGAVPAELDFVSTDDSPVYSDVTITLTHPVNPTDTITFSFLEETESFQVTNVVNGEDTDTSRVFIVTVSFSPEEGPAENTLFVKALYADSISILLTGTIEVIPAPAPSLRRATAISGTEAAATPALSVKDGNIIVSRAPVGSSIQVYSLQGQALKTQTVASDAEVLNTVSFPGSVYIVLVNDKNQEILRQKVVL